MAMTDEPLTEYLNKARCGPTLKAALGRYARVMHIPETVAYRSLLGIALESAGYLSREQEPTADRLIDSRVKYNVKEADDASTP